MIELLAIWIGLILLASISAFVSAMLLFKAVVVFRDFLWEARAFTAFAWARYGMKRSRGESMDAAVDRMVRERVAEERRKEGRHG